MTTDQTLTTSLTDALVTLQVAVVQVNADNGWHETPRTFGEDIALLHSEVSEALEAYRRWGMDDVTGAECVPCREEGEDDLYSHICKPEGVVSELADVLIRMLDLCARHDIDVDVFVDEVVGKVKYNATRGHRHGGRLL